MNLSIPKTNKAEILHTLIEKGCVSIKDFPWLSGFRTRISELVNDDNIPMCHLCLTEVNKFGNSYTYKSHVLSENHRDLAIEKYNSINTKS
jgi:hypothetical protein